ncbi:MAG TPA: hypothetical protein VGE43_17965, partial [Acidimicrobiales bacterium]
SRRAATSHLPEHTRVHAGRRARRGCTPPRAYGAAPRAQPAPLSQHPGDQPPREREEQEEPFDLLDHDPTSDASEGLPHPGRRRPGPGHRVDGRPG